MAVYGLVIYFFSFSWSYGGKFRFKWIIKFLRRLIKGTIRSSILWEASIEISTNKVNQQPLYSSLYMPIEHTPMLADTSTVISLVAYQTTTWQLSVNYCWYIGQLSALNQSIVKRNSTTSPLSISEHPLMGYRYDSNVLNATRSTLDWQVINILVITRLTLDWVTTNISTYISIEAGILKGKADIPLKLQSIEIALADHYISR